jgi:Flp pilus assembly protein TadB
MDREDAKVPAEVIDKGYWICKQKEGAFPKKLHELRRERVRQKRLGNEIKQLLKVKERKKEKGGKRERELIFCLYLFMVAVLVVHFLLGLLLVLLDFALIRYHFGNLVAVLLAHYRRRLYKMVAVLGLF